MNLQKLNYFIAVAQESSVAKAAEKLFVTPSTISQHIAKEEQALGVQLFTRSRENWLPTQAGQVYIDAAKQHLEIHSNMERTILDIANCKTGRFSVGITPGRGYAMFSAIYPQFQKQYPDIHVNLIEANWKRLQSAVLDNTLDLAFTNIHTLDNELTVNFDIIPITNEELILYVPKTHPIAAIYKNTAAKGPVTVDLSLFANDNFLGLSKNTTLYKATNALFEKANIKPNIIFESASTMTIHNLALDGFGLAILPGFYATESDKAVWFKLIPEMQWPTIVATRKGYQINNAMQYFIDLSKKYFKEHPNKNS